MRAHHKDAHDPSHFKSGYVAIIGRPNVGKSTVLNSLLGEKVAIISSKPETTRNKILGILTQPEAQIVFIDTPGIFKPHFTLQRHMVKEAKGSLLDTDIILLVIDSRRGLLEDDVRIIELLRDSKKPTLLALNKIDLTQKSLLLPLIEEASNRYDFKEIIPISATRGDNMKRLYEKLLEYLPQGPQFYPDDQLTDKNERFLAGEIIREKVLELTHQEVPHAIAVLVEEMKERTEKKITYIKATIFVERASQRGILIGKSGAMLKRIGELSRMDIEHLLGQKVFLDLWVKVYKNWRQDERALKMLGY